MKIQNKTKWMLLLVIPLFTLVVGASYTQTEKYKSLLGEWDVETESGQYTFVFNFFMQDEKLAGKFSGSSGETDMIDLSFEENELKFNVNVDGGGQQMAIEFTATIDGDSLSGMLSLEFGEASISGKKRQDKTL